MQDQKRLYQQLIDDYLDHLWKMDPVGATRMGVHDYDDKISADPAQAGEDLKKRREFLTRLEGIDSEQLDAQDALDYPFVRATLKGALDHPDLGLGIRSSRGRRNSPQAFPQVVSNAIFPLLIGDFAGTEERAASVLARLRKVPELLTNARGVLDESVPALWVDMARSATNGARKFLDTAVRSFAGESETLTRDMMVAIARADDALADYLSFCEELAHRAQGDYAIGKEKFDYILQNMYMLDLDHRQLYEFGQDEVERYRSDMETLAGQMGFGTDWVSALERVKDHHPAAADLVKEYDDEVELARQFVIDKDLVTVPSQGNCPCEWMPVFMRDYAPIALPWSSPMFDPGYAGKWHITPVDDEAPVEVQQQHLRDNSYAWIRSIAHHEIYPGHYMQALITKLVGTKFRKVFSDPVYTEGWPMYWEEYLRDIGFLSTPPLHLMQLRNALWRAVRIVVDTGLHTRGMSVEEATRYLVDTARLEERWATSQARGYTTSATYQSTYLLGKREVIRLKDAYQKKMGDDYTEKEFHDSFLQYGSMPVALVRKAMLGE